MKISIIGMGYVGLPLALMLSKNYKITGFDIDSFRIKNLLNNFDFNKQHSSREIKEFNKSNLFTCNESNLIGTNIFIITVPTPVKKNKPHLKILKSATEMVAKYLIKNSIVIYESTVYPGVTENICRRILEKISKLKYKRDFNLAYSPERVNPGDKKRTIEKINKVIGASNVSTMNKVKKIYSSFLGKKVYTVSDIKTAEASKVIENAQRDINIAFMNELYEIFHHSDINIKEVLSAANTKWNFLKFEPGLVGGHCIGVDPYYLAEFAKKNNVKPKIVLSGRKTNEDAVKVVFNIICKKLKNINNPKILILGATFKENCPDVRNSKILELDKLLNKNKYYTEIYDPWIKNKNLKNIFLDKMPLNKKYHLIFIGVKHKYFKNLGLIRIKKSSSLKKVLIYDYKNIFGII